MAKSNKKAPPIAEVIAKKKEQLLAERKQLDVDGLTAALSFAEYCQVLDKTFQVVSEILRDFKLSQQFNQDQVYSKWLQANCQHLINRLKYVRLAPSYHFAFAHFVCRVCVVCTTHTGCCRARC